MRVVAQKIDDILASLQPLIVEWKDDVASRVIRKIETLPVKPMYTEHDVIPLLSDNFDDGLLICRLFLGLSADQFRGQLAEILGKSGSGITRYRKDRTAFMEGLLSLGLLEAMTAEVNRVPLWSDVLIERLRSGRGSAISGQKRGRGVEDFAEDVVRRVFGEAFELRCTFVGARSETAKCDIAIPSKADPRIVVEAKGYGATGSKQSDVLGDIRDIVRAKRADTAFLFFTDGVTWKQRQSDLRKIVEYQNNGDVTRIYTYAMAEQFEADLRQLKEEYGL